MTQQELEALVKLGESETLEFKKTTGQLKPALETIAAFLNHKGGIVLIGVDRKGHILGQDVTDSTQQEIAQEIRKIEPAISPDINYLSIGSSKKLIILAVPAGDQKPYLYDGRAYRRIGSATQRMTHEHQLQYFQSNAYHTHPWESLPAREINLQDLDQAEIVRTIKEGVAKNKIDNLYDTNDPINILHGLGLMKGNVLFNAAVVLFGLNFKPYYFQCRAKLARFRGIDKDEFLDSRQVEGHAFKLYEECLAFINRYNSVSSHFKSGISKRIDEPTYPPLAVREALVNALVHRDYTQHGGAIRIAIYDDRLEIWSSGILPKGVHLEELWDLHTSQPRNELIADTFHRRGLLEEWGRGTNKIINECRNWGNKDPEFFEQMGSFCVRIWAKEHSSSLIVNPEEKSIGVDLLTQMKALSKRQYEIIGLLEKFEELRASEIKDKLSNTLADRTLRDDLLYLKQLKLLETKGRGKATTWRLGVNKPPFN